MTASLFDALPVALLRLDAGGALLAVNAAAASALGLAPPASVPSDAALAALRLTGRDGTPCSFRHLASRFTGADASQTENVLLHRGDGVTLALEVRAAPLPDDEGGGLVLVLHDVTALERAVCASRQVQERMNRSQEIAHLGSWELDVVANRLIWSDEVYRIFGLQPQEFQATYDAFLEAVHPDDRAAVDEAYSGSIREARDSYEIEHRIVRRSDGTVRVVHERCEHVRDESGRIVRSVGMVHDVTERQHSEALLRERSGQLAQADRIKDEFLATLSHELRTPLSTILVWAHLLVHTELDEPARRRAQEVILASASAQKEIIDEVLDVSRIISGKMALNVAEVALDRVLAGALEVIRPAAAAKRLHLEIQSEPGLLVLGDAARLQQVLWNLLANAVKFSEEGGAVRVAASRDGAQVRVTVTDEGIGISPDFLPHVFDRFAQQDASPNRLHGGLGLGLAITRHLVELHGGIVEAESAGEGRGATFTVLLPARLRRGGRGPERRHPQQETGLAPAALHSARLEGVRALVVDDEADAREVTGTVLQQAGARVALAANADEALGRLQEEEHDVVIADIAMPGTDGYALIAALRALPGPASRIPAIALTAYGRDSDRARALEAGFDRHLAKPATPAQLTDVLVKLLARRQPKRPVN